MKTAELRKKNVDDLRKQLDAWRDELMQLRFQHATGALENPSRLAHVKRDVARLLTVLNEQQGTSSAAAATPAAEPAPATTEA